MTLLLGKDGKIADVVSPNSTSKADVIGFVSEIGAKEFFDNGKTTKEYYAKIVSADGTATEYKTKTKSDTFKNSVVKVTFDSGYAKLSRVSENKKVGGVFDFDSKTLGAQLISSNVKILDVYSSKSGDVGLFSMIYPQRIDGVSIPQNKILYCEEDSKGRITELILENVTGDMLKYGIMIKVQNSSDDYYLSGYYKYDIAGTEYELETANQLFSSVQLGVPIKVVMENDEVKIMQSLSVIKGNLTSLSYSMAKIGNTNYAVSSDVCVYVRNYYGTYLTMTLDELINNLDKYTVSAYEDKSTKSGGCIRVLVVSAKN